MSDYPAVLFFSNALRKQINFLSMIHRTEKAHSSFIGKKFTVGKHHVVVEVEFINSLS